MDKSVDVDVAKSQPLREPSSNTNHPVKVQCVACYDCDRTFTPEDQKMSGRQLIQWAISHARDTGHAIGINMHDMPEDDDFRCHVCKEMFAEFHMKVGIMHQDEPDTENRYNLCNSCYHKRGSISELDTVYFKCSHCGNTLPHYVMERVDKGWCCKEPYGSCYDSGGIC